MWVILVVVAAISLIIFFMRGPNAVWGGATGGLTIGIVVALVSRGFNWSVIWKGIVVGTLLGVAAELIGGLAKRLKKKSEH